MIRLPVSHISGLSEAFVARHLEQRQRAAFASLNDFLERCSPGASGTHLLLDAGALDCFGYSRPELFWRLRADSQKVKTSKHRKVKKLGIADYGAHATPGRIPSHQPLVTSHQLRITLADCGMVPPVTLTEPDARHVAQRETELLGFPVTVDPLAHLGTDENGRGIDWTRYVPVARLREFAGKSVSVCGLMVSDRIDATQQGELMKFVTLADRSGFVEAILFPDVYRRFGYLTAAHPILAARGMVKPFENNNGLILQVQHVTPPRMRE